MTTCRFLRIILKKMARRYRELFTVLATKFRALIALTLISLILMAAASLWANHRVSSALQAREQAAAYASASTQLMNHWWQQNALRQQITPTCRQRSTAVSMSCKNSSDNC